MHLRISQPVSRFKSILLRQFSVHGMETSSLSPRLDLQLNVQDKEGVVSAFTQRGPLPIITGRELHYCPAHRVPRQAWVENLDCVKEEKLGLIDLHPDVFGQFPRMDMIHANVVWQKKYKSVEWKTVPTRAEMPGGGKKPHPQKGLGRARHGSIRSPLYYGGGQAHGPRGPRTNYYMLPFYVRVKGLCNALSVKLAQDDLKIVDSLEIPTKDPKFLEKLAEDRHWGISVLFVDDTDVMPENISLASDTVGHLNLMPVYGLNVYSMLKHETLVLTIAAVNKIEEKLVFHLNRHDARYTTNKDRLRL